MGTSVYAKGQNVAFLTTLSLWYFSIQSEVKVTKSCLTLCHPMDYTVHGILQARILEWVAFPFSRVSSQSRDRTQVSHIAGRFFTSWTTREALNTKPWCVLLCDESYSNIYPGKIIFAFIFFFMFVNSRQYVVNFLGNMIKQQRKLISVSIWKLWLQQLY